MSPSTAHVGALEERISELQAQVKLAREATEELERVMREHQVILRAGLPLMTQLEITRQFNAALLALGVRGLKGAGAVVRPVVPGGTL